MFQYKMPCYNRNGCIVLITVCSQNNFFRFMEKMRAADDSEGEKKVINYGFDALFMSPEHEEKK